MEKAVHQGWMGKEEMTVRFLSPPVPLVPPPQLLTHVTASLLGIGVDLKGIVMSNVCVNIRHREVEAAAQGHTARTH